MSAHVEITVQPPDVTGALCLFAAVVAIDIACLRFRRATISRWCRYSVRRRPIMASAVATLLTAHLVFDTEADPLRWLSRLVDRG